MKLKFCFPLAFATAMLFGICASGQQNNPRQTGTARFGNPTATAQHLQNYIYGVVRRIDKDHLVLDKTEFGDEQPFKLEPKTKYVYNGKAARPGDFKSGDQVFVQIKKDKKTGDMIARRVEAGVPSSTP